MTEEGEATITAYPDGPYLVRGCYTIVDVDGRAIETSRRTVALCRCGRSSEKPLCDGSHAVSAFRDSARSNRADPQGRS